MYLRQILISLFVAASLHVIVASGLLNQVSVIINNKISQATQALVINRFLSDGIVSLGVLFVARDFIVSKCKALFAVVSGSHAVCTGDRCRT